MYRNHREISNSLTKNLLGASAGYTHTEQLLANSNLNNNFKQRAFTSMFMQPMMMMLHSSALLILALPILVFV